MLAKGSVCLLLLLGLSLSTAAALSASDSGLSRFYIKKDRPPGYGGGGGGGPIRRSGEASATARRESGFDPDVLNRFLEEYASKIKRTTERPAFGYDEDSRLPQDTSQDLEAIAIETGDKESNDTRPAHGFRVPARLNDTVKRHKFYGANSHSVEDRNTGWVTLDAIPWSKSKISKWQANPTTQGPWPDSNNKWDSKPGFAKPWNSDYPTRPSSPHESNKPWHNKKPHWTDNAQSGSNKPWYSDGTRPGHHDRPSYPTIDKYEDNPNQAQKWPPERPSWDREPSRPSLDIDVGPPNFPNNNWERPGQKPSYTHHMESYVNEPGGWHDRNDFPSNANHNNKYRPNDDNYYNDRPNFSHYNYPSTGNSGGGGGGGGGAYPPSHPSSGDGQWVLLSTNRGYSKSRQRSIKFDTLVNADTTGSSNSGSAKPTASTKKNGQPPFVASNEENVPAVTSKRQIRLTVLPSINGTNTTTSHGGLLEVERTFKTVDQSQKEYERERKSNGTAQQQHKPGLPLGTKILVNKRPIRNTLIGGPVSNSAVLAAVGAGMLPATMAMMIPMMLGRRRRKRRSLEGPTIVSLPVEALNGKMLKRRRI